MNPRIAAGDVVNDWDFKFPAGTVIAVDPHGEWFEAEWSRGGVTYAKRHPMNDLAPWPGEKGKLVNLSRKEKP